MVKGTLAGILVAGHTSVDHVVSSTGSRTQPGGAALYAAMAAKVFSREVGLVTAVGKDFEYLDALKGFPSAHILITKAKSSRFDIRYDSRWNARYEVSAFGAARYLRASRIVSAAAGYSCVHLAPMPPEKVRKVVEGLRRKGGVTISMNSWDGYMSSREDRNILKRLMSEVDYFIVNEGEIMRLAGVDSTPAAFRVLDPSHLVVTLGDLGAIYTREGRLEISPATLGIKGQVVDTTGAGDAWCGALVGALTLGEDMTSCVNAASMISALKCRGPNFERIMNLRFGAVEELIDYVVRLREGGQLTLKKYL